MTETAISAPAQPSAVAKSAIIHRMVMPGHICPYGLKALHLLKRKGFTVEDRWLTTRDEVDAFKAKNDVQTTPQIFIGGERIGGRSQGDHLPTGDCLVRNDGFDGACGKFRGLWNAFHDSRGRMVHRIQHVYPRDAQASKCR